MDCEAVGLMWPKYEFSTISTKYNPSYKAVNEYVMTGFAMEEWTNADWVSIYNKLILSNLDRT